MTAGWGALDRRILALAVPAAASSMLHVVHRWVDMYWIGQLGTDAIASLSLSSITVWMYTALGTLVGTGLTALVARYVGAGRGGAAGWIGTQGLGWAAVIGVVGGIAGQAVAPLFFVATNAAPDVAANGVAYTRIFYAGGVLMLLQIACDAIFRGHGNTRIPFLAALVALVVNVTLDPLLIHGWGPIPALGVPGAAWATLIATAIGVALLVFSLVRRRHVARARPPDDRLRLDQTTRIGTAGVLGLDLAILRRITRVGLPLAAAGLFFSSILLVLQRIAADAGGSAAQAGLGIGHTGEGVAYVMCLGWAAAASALVGQALGAGKPEEAERAAWRAVLQCSFLCFLWALVLFFFADEVAMAITSQQAGDTLAREYGASYFRIVALCLVPQAAGMVVYGAFGGAGLTLPPMLISTFFSLIRIPLAWIAAFPLGLGVDGIWWTIAVTTVLRGLVEVAYFARGTWKTRSV